MLTPPDSATKIGRSAHPLRSMRELATHARRRTDKSSFRQPNRRASGLFRGDSSFYLQRCRCGGAA
jgi:hypothetical protein